jgi:hypothetical protein
LDCFEALVLIDPHSILNGARTAGLSMPVSSYDKGYIRIITHQILAAFVLLIIGSGCQSGQTTNIPDDMVGIWETSATKYKDRFMEFKKDVLIFGTGDGDQTVQAIQKVKADRQDQQDFYTVYYRDDDGEEYSFSFFYDPVGGVIKLKNQEDIEWKKNSGTTD